MKTKTTIAETILIPDIRRTIQATVVAPPTMTHHTSGRLCRCRLKSNLQIEASQTENGVREALVNSELGWSDKHEGRRGFCDGRRCDCWVRVVGSVRQRWGTQRFRESECEWERLGIWRVLKFSLILFVALSW